MSTLIVKNLDAPTGESIVAPDLTLPQGSVVQVVQTVHNNKDNYQLNLAWSQITALNCEITPSSTNSKILVSAVLHISSDVDQTNPYPIFRLTKGGSAISEALGTASGTRRIGTTAAGITGNAHFDPKALPIEYLDSPSTTSPITYGVQISGYDNRTMALNASGISDANGGYTVISSITLMEIAG